MDKILASISFEEGIIWTFFGVMFLTSTMATLILFSAAVRRFFRSLLDFAKELEP